MENILYTLLNVTVLSSAAILAVMLTKALFRNNIGAKAVSILWALVLLRLLMPVTIESPIRLSQLLPESKPETEQVYTPSASDHYFENNVNEHNTDIFTLGDAPLETSQISNVNNINTLPEDNTGEQISFSQRMKTFLYSIDISMTAFIVWFAVGTAFILMCVFNIIRFNSRLGNSVVLSKKLLEAFSVAKKNLNFGNKVKIAESKEVDMPITYGLIKPVIVIPEDMAAVISSRKLTLIIMHELMHIKRSDIFKNYLWLLAKAAHWFNPLVWIAYRMYLRDMEIVCDKMVIENTTGDERTEYSQSLLESARFMKRQNRVMSPAMLSFSEDRSKLRRRIMNILNPVKQSRRQIFALGLMIIVLVAGCFTTACTGNQEEEALSLNSTDAALESQPVDVVVEMDSSSDNSDDDPYTWKQRQTLNDIEVTVNINLDSVNIPERTIWPIIRLDSEHIDNDTVKKAAEYFLNGEYYNPALTKSDVQKTITDMQEAFSTVDSAWIRQTADNIAEELTIKMETMPEDNIRITQDQIVLTQDSYSLDYMLTNDESVYIKSYNKNGDIMQLGASNYSHYNSVLSFKRDAGENKYLKTSVITNKNDDSSYDDAYLKALEVVNFFADDMVLNSSYSGVGDNPYLWTMQEESQIIEDSNNPCYFFIFTPTVEGIPVYRTVEEKETIYNAFLFKSSYIEVIVDTEGIAEFTWYSSLGNEGYIKENAKIITCEDALETLKENIFATSEWDDYTLYSCNVDIRNVSLQMLMIQDDGGTRMIPVYVFEGSYENSAPIEYKGIYYQGGRKYMIIDALSGRVIDFN